MLRDEEGAELRRPSVVTTEGAVRAAPAVSPEPLWSQAPTLRAPLMLTTWHLPFGGLTLARPPQAPFM